MNPTPNSKFFHLSKSLIKTITSQDKLTKLFYCLQGDTQSYTRNLHFFSKMRTLSSLNSLHLTFHDDGKYNRTSLKVLMMSIASLKNLTNLTIHFSSYVIKDHRIFKDLLFYISKISSLTHLKLTFQTCNLSTSSHFKPFAAKLKKLTQLHSLQLIFGPSSGFTEQFINELAFNLPKLRSLTNIGLHFTGQKTIDGTTIVRLFHSLKAMKMLSGISLSFLSCNVVNSTLSIDAISQGLALLDPLSITKLMLNFYTNFDDKCLAKFSQTLQRFTSLSTILLNFSDCELAKEEVIASLGEALHKLIPLTSLTLSFRIKSASEGFIGRIAGFLKSMEKLTALHLHFAGQMTSANNDYIHQLFLSLGCLKSLQVLFLNYGHEKKIINKNLETLAQSLEKLSMLKNLAILFKSAHYSNQGIAVLCDSIQRLQKLYYLKLGFGYSNAINEETLEIIAKALQKIPSLYEINFNFLGCGSGSDDGFAGLFRRLKDIKSIGNVYTFLSSTRNSIMGRQAAHDLSQKKIVKTYWL